MSGAQVSRDLLDTAITAVPPACLTSMGVSMFLLVASSDSLKEAPQKVVCKALLGEFGTKAHCAGGRFTGIAAWKREYHCLTVLLVSMTATGFIIYGAYHLLLA